MARLKNVECAITTASGALQEHDSLEMASADAESDVPTKTVYIQVDKEETFSIDITVLSTVNIFPKADSLRLSFSFDGEKIARKRITQLIAEGSIPVTGHFTGISKKIHNQWLHQKFMFSPLTFSEKLDDAERKSDLPSLGEVKVLVRRFKKGRVSPSTGSISQDVKVVVREKDLKGRDVTHSVKLSQGTNIESPRDYVRGDCLDSEEEPYAVFRFLYRSKAALQSLGFVERTPSLSPQPFIFPSPSPLPVTTEGNTHGLLAIAQMSSEALNAELRLHRLLFQKDGGNNSLLDLKPVKDMTKEEMAAELSLHRVLLNNKTESARTSPSAITPARSLTPANIKREHAEGSTKIKRERADSTGPSSSDRKRRKSGKVVLTID